MQIIKSGSNYILVDPQPTEPGYVWGQRWNRNEGRWSTQCMLWPDGVNVDLGDLPGKLPEVEVK